MSRTLSEYEKNLLIDHISEEIKMAQMILLNIKTDFEMLREGTCSPPEMGESK